MKRFSVTSALLLGCVVAFAGCGGKTKTEETKTGDGGGGNGKLSKPINELIVGTWELQMELDDAKVEDMLKKQGGGKTIPEDAMKKQKEFVKKMFSGMTMTLEIKADGTAVATTTQLNPLDPDGKAKAKTEPSTWKIASTSGKSAELEVTEKGKTRTTKITFIDDDTIRIDDEEISKAPIKEPTLKRKK